MVGLEMDQSYQQKPKNRLPCIVTTSWDDGSVLDLKLAKLLDKYSLKATFYVPKHYLSQPLSERDILNIAERQEIGAHGINHNDLTQLTMSEAFKEIRESKEFLESILKQEVNLFAYPLGLYNQVVKQGVQQAGFIGARTIKPFHFSPDYDPFEMNVSLHVYPFPLGRKGTWNYPFSRTLIQPIRLAYRDVFRLGLPLKSLFSWKNLAKEIFNYVIYHGGIFHLWGHSWEIEQFDMWKSLEEIFEFISRRQNGHYFTNSDCLQLKDENIIHQ
jgi:peptidoglycan/xylan/chitin deacetylase (PgdA/CDA1 family)